jgi:hypothetical protein
MIKWFLRRWIDKFERTWSYDTSYLRDILDADPRALMLFSKAAGIGTYRKDVPLAARCAAGIVACELRVRGTSAARSHPGGMTCAT